MVTLAAQVAGPELSLSDAYAEVVSRVMGFGWQHLAGMSDSDKDEIIAVMVRIYDAVGRRAPEHPHCTALDAAQCVIHILRWGRITQWFQCQHLPQNRSRPVIPSGHPPETPSHLHVGDGVLR